MDGVMKTLLPWVLGLVASLATAAFSFAWKTSQDVAIIKAQLSMQAVSPIEFARLQTKVEQLEKADQNQHDDFGKQLDNLREWMRRSRRTTDGEPPPAAAAEPNP